MVGRSGLCLLAVIWMTPSLFGQAADRPGVSPTAAADVLSRAPRSDVPESRVVASPVLPPEKLSPRFPIGPPGEFGFPQFERAAGMIFSGTVMRIARRPANLGQAVETVAITFHVENAIRGVTPGEELTISQWVGLWTSGQRYRVGERVLLFLYPNSKLGLTSCVGGPLGRFDEDAAGRVWLTAQHLGAFRRDPVLGGKSRVRTSDFALAVRRAGEEE